MKLLTKWQQKSYKNERICNVCKKIKSKYVKENKYCKVRDHCHYTGEYSGVVHSICTLKYSVPRKSS